MRSRSAFGALLLLAACGGAPKEEAESVAGATPASPELEFTPDFRINQTLPLVSGDRVVIHYDASRLSSCRGEINGGPAWTITAFAMLNRGTPVAKPIWGHSADGSVLNGTTSFELPVAGELEIWFQITDRWGCNAWDSSFGRNYRFRVIDAPVATIRFARDWSETITGRLTGGATVVLDYDLSRLPNCRQGYNGFGTWDILAFYRFDGGSVENQAVTTPNGMDRIASPARVSIPRGARSFEVWFKNTDRGGCVQYDSDYGANYRFSVE